MLDAQKITRIARDVARTQVAGASLKRIMTEPATDSEGKEALRIILVLKPQAARKLTGDQALDLLVGIQQKLEASGEERFPIVEYATERELVSQGGQE
jgi:hypothetical protein